MYKLLNDLGIQETEPAIIIEKLLEKRADITASDGTATEINEIDKALQSLAWASGISIPDEIASKELYKKPIREEVKVSQNANSSYSASTPITPVSPVSHVASSEPILTAKEIRRDEKRFKVSFASVILIILSFIMMITPEAVASFKVYNMNEMINESAEALIDGDDYEDGLMFSDMQELNAHFDMLIAGSEDVPMTSVFVIAFFEWGSLFLMLISLVLVPLALIGVIKRETVNGLTVLPSISLVVQAIWIPILMYMVNNKFYELVLKVFGVSADEAKDILGDKVDALRPFELNWKWYGALIALALFYFVIKALLSKSLEKDKKRAMAKLTTR